jgi:EmrB/QacA subfamily drug resistance transporter
MSDTTQAATAAPADYAAKERWWILTTIALGTFMSARDGSVVNAILPLLQRSLHSSEDTIQWVLTVYLLVVSGLLLSVGRWGDMHGHRPVYVGGMIVFLISSVFCAIAPSAEVLIGARVVQSVGAAMLFASGPAIITQNFPAEMRGQALGVQLTMTYLGLTLGPLLGGWMAKFWGWQSVFYTNIPIGIPALLMALRFIPRDRLSENKKRFDVAGAVLFLVGLTAVLVGLNKAHQWGWGSPSTLGVLAVGAVILAGFFMLENRVQDPMLDMILVRKRIFALAGLSALLCYIGLYSILFLVPYYYIRGRGIGADHAGVILAAQPLAMAAIASFSGAISDKIGTKWPTTIGMVLMAIGLLVLAQLGPTSTDAFVILGLVLAGLGTGMFVSPNNSAMLGSAPRERRGIASGIMATARNIGMALGIAMAGAIFTSVLSTQGKSPTAVMAGTHAGFIGAAIVALLGAVTSWVREP